MSKSFHRFAIIVAVLTIGVILAGGNVTSRGAGMAFRDWPLSDGSLNPPGWLHEANKLAEHGHRLIAEIVGILTLLLAFWIERLDRRAWARRLGLWAAGGVILLGTVGGFRVLLDQQTVAIPHAGLAYLFFCLMTAIAVVTSPGWHADPGGVAAPRLRGWAIASVIMIYLQIMIGAVMRHTGAGMAIPTFPDSFGQWLPPTFTGPIAIHFAHRVGAVIVLIVLHIFAIRAFRTGVRAVRRPLVALLLLVGAQILLGAQVIWTGKSEGWTTLHVGCGAAILGLSVMIALMVFRATRPVEARA